jgi:ribosome-associated protein
VTSKNKALLIAELAKSKKAENIVILDMRKLSSITDFLIIASSSSVRRSQSIAENIKEGVKEAKETFYKIEGYQEGDWILIDAYDVVSHIFLAEKREFYNLEELWGDASRVKLVKRKKKKSAV